MNYLTLVCSLIAVWGNLTASLVAQNAQNPQEKPLGLRLPTDNRFIYSSEPQKFYMYTTRNFEGVPSKPWTAGQYGYVRNLRRTTGEGVIATKFHEGIDIRPLKRDRANRPLDYIRAIAAGKVVYFNDSAGGSNYGRYIVIEHDWGLGKFYSLYAHLDKVQCKLNQPVKSGTIIAKMGYTGAGINRERAHLHLELNIMSNRDFSHWHKHYFGSSNTHGIFNGLNLYGLNISELFIRHNKNGKLKLSEFIKKIPVYYKITVPRKKALDIAQRYPWICKGDLNAPSPSWEISYASSGFPLEIARSMRRVSKPTVSYVTPTKSNHSYHTKRLITGTKDNARLTKLGLRTISLLTGEFPRMKPKPLPEETPKAIPVE